MNLSFGFSLGVAGLAIMMPFAVIAEEPAQNSSPAPAPEAAPSQAASAPAPVVSGKRLNVFPSVVYKHFPQTEKLLGLTDEKVSELLAPRRMDERREIRATIDKESPDAGAVAKLKELEKKTDEEFRAAFEAALSPDVKALYDNIVNAVKEAGKRAREGNDWTKMPPDSAERKEAYAKHAEDSARQAQEAVAELLTPEQRTVASGR